MHKLFRIIAWLFGMVLAAAAVDANPIVTSIGTGTDFGTSANFTITTSASVASGDTIVVCANDAPNGGTISGVADSIGNIYTLDKKVGTGNPTLYIFTAVNAAGLSSGSTITISGTAPADNKTAAAADVTGLAASPLDATGGSATGLAASITTNSANELIVACSGWSNGTFTQGAAFTTWASISGSHFGTSAGGTDFVASAGTVNYSASTTGSAGGVALASYKTATVSSCRPGSLSLMGVGC